MPRPRLYCANLIEGSVVLSKDESHHAIDVRRVQVGDEVCLFDGFGGESVGVVAEAGRHLLRVAVQEVLQRPFELSRKMTLAVAMPKGPRAGYLVEKCTELGVAAIWPILAERSVAKPGSDSYRKWCRRAVEAAKQSQRAWVPTIAPPQSFCDSVARVGEFEGACLADTTKSATSLRAFLAAPSSSVLVWIGPEGGWTSTERAQAMEAGAVPVRLGPTVLRAETAAVAACAAVAILDHK